MKPRASAPRITSGLRGRAHSASWSIVSWNAAGSADQRHQVLEDDPRLREVRDVADERLQMVASSSVGRLAEVADEQELGELLRDARERLEIVERRPAALEVARAEPRWRRAAPAAPTGARRRCGRRAGGARRSRGARYGRTRRRCRPRSPGRAGRRPRSAARAGRTPRAGVRTSGVMPARSQSSARSTSSSCVREPRRAARLVCAFRGSRARRGSPAAAGTRRAAAAGS